MNDFLTMMQSFCEKLLQQQQAANIDQPPLQELSIQEMEDLKQHYLDEMLILSNDLGIKDYRNEKIDIRFRRECEDMIDELKGKFNRMSIEINKKKELQCLEQDPEESLIMRNEELSTIPKKKSEEFIKSSVEDLVPIRSDDIELLLHHDLSIPKMSVVSILEGFTDEPPLEENDDLFDLESKEIEWKKILYDDDFYDSKGDVLYLESFLIDDITPNLPPEEFLDRDPRSFNDLKIMVKIFDPRIHEKSFSPTYVSLPFTDHAYLFFTYVVQILLPYFTYSVVSPFLLSSRSEDTIFDLDISAFHFLAPVASHRSGTFISFNVYPNILNESLMEICSSPLFIDLIKHVAL
uniref:Reverse transcriptase domain-containing protein n=1 Tax=Tanacetum cinerariifolium TaxID=118510 RepID=A0A6L2MTC8_TANCI|nr:hypothetical protein [Tanacetum cinerariifolium]